MVRVGCTHGSQQQRKVWYIDNKKVLGKQEQSYFNCIYFVFYFFKSWVFFVVGKYRAEG